MMDVVDFLASFPGCRFQAAWPSINKHEAWRLSCL